MMSTDQSYEDSARYYDAAYGAVKTLGPDTAFYEQLAVECGGPVLELGCGTGRALLPIAAQGLACSGIDRSAGMLEQFRRHPAAAGIHLTQASMEEFDLGACRFRLIFSAFRAFQHLDTVDQQLACLARVRTHLAPGGVFAFDVFNPKLSRMALDHEPETIDLTFTCEDRQVQRFVSVTRDYPRQVNTVKMRYVEEREEGKPLETEVTFTMRWFWRYELEHLMRLAGFADVTIYGNFDRSPVGRDSPAFVVVAR